MSSNIQVGKFLYSRMDLAFIGKILNEVTSAKNGITFAKLASMPEILKDFQNDFDRSQGKVKATLSGLRFRGVVSEVKGLDHSVTYRILDKKSSEELIKAGSEYINKIQQKAESIETVGNVPAVSGVVSKQVNKVNGNKKMSNLKNIKPVRMFMNLETNKVQEFGLGRPSKEKLACECNSEGKLLNAAAFATVATGFVKTVKAEGLIKMLKPELMKKIETLMQELEAVKAQRDQWAAIAQSFQDEDEVETDEDSALSLNAEQVEEDSEDSEEDSEDSEDEEDSEDSEDEEDSEDMECSDDSDEETASV